MFCWVLGRSTAAGWDGWAVWGAGAEQEGVSDVYCGARKVFAYGTVDDFGYVCEEYEEAGEEVVENCLKCFLNFFCLVAGSSKVLQFISTEKVSSVRIATARRLWRDLCDKRTEVWQPGTVRGCFMFALFILIFFLDYRICIVYFYIIIEWRSCVFVHLCTDESRRLSKTYQMNIRVDKTSI